MAVSMTRPTPHPKTGTYLVRLTIPPPIRETAKRLFGVTAELRENLGTKDAAEARRRAPAAITRLQAKLDKARAILTEVPRPPSLREVAALAGEFYRSRVGADGDEGLQALHMEINLELFGNDPAFLSADDPAFEPEAITRQRAETLLRDHGFATDPDSVRQLCMALVRAEKAFLKLLKQRAEGDWSPDPNLPKFPTLPPPPSSAPPAPRLTFDDLLAGWARDHGWDLAAKPIARAAYDRKQTIARLGDFLGHTDALKVTQADAVRWKESMQAKALAVATIRNDLSEMSAVWKWGIRNGKVDSNPFEGVSPPKERGKKRQRRAFTESEAVAILTAARSNTGYMRWLPWVCCLTGARISEICQSTKGDVTEIDGVPVLRITDEGDADQDAARSLKNEDSRRDVPIHPALVAEGFLDYVRGLPAGSPLFPDAKPDKVFGLRSTIASRNISRWLKQDLQITDERISPNHSWRHYFIGACRRVAMNPEIRSALTGHSAKMDESSGYGDGMKTFIHVLAESIAKVKPPVPPLGDKKAGVGGRHDDATASLSA